MLHRLRQRRKIISLLSLPVVLGAWLLLNCQLCLAGVPLAAAGSQDVPAQVVPEAAPMAHHGHGACCPPAHSTPAPDPGADGKAPCQDGCLMTNMQTDTRIQYLGLDLVEISPGLIGMVAWTAPRIDTDVRRPHEFVPQHPPRIFETFRVLLI